MNNLQLYITKTYEGFQNMLEINQQDAIKQQVIDLTDAIANIKYDTERINIFYMLRYTDQGVFFIILRTIPTNANDHLAAWIFVPSSISVPESDLKHVVDSVVDIISNSRITSEQFADMRRIFAKEYEPMMSPAATVANFGTKYAHRYIGVDTGYELTDFLGNKKYQTSNLQYAGVILASRGDAPTITGPDITDEPLEQMVKLFPPKLNSDIYTPIIYGQPFNKPYLVPLMGAVEILWTSPKAVDVRQSIMISKPNMRPEPIAASVAPAPKPSVQEAKAQEATEPKAADESTAVSATETPASAPTANPANVHQAKDPEPTAKADEPKGTPNQPAEIVGTTAETQTEQRRINHDRQHLYNFEIPSKSADISGVIKFEVRTHTELTGSPIDGYDLSEPIQEGVGRNNHLVYLQPNDWQTKAIYGAAGLVIGILLTLLCTCSFGSSSAESTEGESTDSTTVTEQPVAAPQQAVTEANAETPAEKPAAMDTSLEAAIKYLDTNTAWDKNVLESYPDLKGLYNDMNTFDKKRLVEYWKPKLKDSRRFNTVATHAKLGMKKTPRVAKAGQKTFNRPDESIIKIQSYLNTIDP